MKVLHIDYDPVTEGGKTGSGVLRSNEITVEGCKKYVVTNIEGNYCNRNEAVTCWRWSIKHCGNCAKYLLNQHNYVKNSWSTLLVEKSSNKRLH